MRAPDRGGCTPARSGRATTNQIMKISRGDVMTDLGKYILNAAFLDKVVSAQEAASWIEDGMTLGMSGFTLFGEPKEFPKALSERGQKEKFQVNLFTGASMGPAAAQSMAEAGIINKRIPYQGNPVQRKK